MLIMFLLWEVRRLFVIVVVRFLNMFRILMFVSLSVLMMLSLLRDLVKLRIFVNVSLIVISMRIRNVC